MALPVAPRHKILLDTNIFIDYLRVGRHENWVAGTTLGAIRFLSSIVLLELRLGADTPRRQRVIDRIRDGLPSNRIIAPTAALHDLAGGLFRKLYGFGSGDRLAAMNDLLIALSARHIGAELITSNRTDFEKIASHVRGFRWRLPD